MGTFLFEICASQCSAFLFKSKLRVKSKLYLQYIINNVDFLSYIKIKTNHCSI